MATRVPRGTGAQARRSRCAGVVRGRGPVHRALPGPESIPAGACRPGKGPGETSRRCAASHAGGCSFPELWLGDTHELINP